MTENDLGACSPGDLVAAMRAIDAELVWRTLKRETRRASPLALSVADAEAIDLSALLLGIELPRSGLPLCVGCGLDTSPPDPHAVRHIAASALSRSGALDGGAVPWQPFAFRSRLVAEVRSGRADGGGLAFSIVRGTVEMAIDLGGHRLSTDAGFADLRLDMVLPETIAIGIVGERIDRVCEHPLLASRDYPIVSLVRVGDRVRSVRFRTGLDEFALIGEARARAKGRRWP